MPKSKPVKEEEHAPSSADATEGETPPAKPSPQKALADVGLPPELQVAFVAGYDAAINGPDTINCYFGIFSTPEQTKAWERGNAAAHAALAKARGETE